MKVTKAEGTKERGRHIDKGAERKVKVQVLVKGASRSLVCFIESAGRI